MSGIVFMGIASSFPFMLSENGIQISKISLIFIATLPYGFKFILAPIIKNFISRSKVKFDCVKLMSFISQFIVFILFSTLGIFAQNKDIYLAFAVIFLLTTVISIHDIIISHVKLSSFNKERLGIPTSVSNFGFRIGSFIASYFMFYISDVYSWKVSFFTISLSILFLTISTFFLPGFSQNQLGTEKELFKCYMNSFLTFFKKYNIWIFLLIIFSFKFSDSCINNLKPLFLQIKGLSKTDFANIAQMPGLFCLILGGFIAGIASYRMGINNCIKLSLFGQVASAAIFILLSIYNFDFHSMLALIACSTLFFGFSTVILRTFIAQKSNADIVTYTILLSIGSILRVLCSYFGGIIVEYTSWRIVFISCIISNIPLICFGKNLLKKLELEHKL